MATSIERVDLSYRRGRLEMFPNAYLPEFNAWDPDNFGPITLPSRGMIVELTPRNIALYRRAISTYEGHDLEIVGDVRIDGQPATTYTFGLDYYWMMGDNRHRSADSRMWGFVPETHIIGRASFVWFSKQNAAQHGETKSAGTACSKASSDRRPSPLPVSTLALVGTARQGGIHRCWCDLSEAILPEPDGHRRTAWPNASRFLCSMRMRNPNCSSLITNLQCRLAFVENRLRGVRSSNFSKTNCTLWMEHLPKQGEHTKSLQAWCDASIQWCAPCVDGPFH